MNKPLFNLRDKNLSASCFVRSGEKDGRSYSFKSICLQRSYKKKGDEDFSHEQININHDDLLKLARLCVSAYTEGLSITAQETSDDLPNDGIPF
jgi:hypothetical protein